MSQADTICALATPPGESALAVVRVSGSLCPELAVACFDRKHPPLPRQSTLATYRSLDGQALDQALVLLFNNNKSYTGEAVMEISLHGNPLVAQAVIDDLLQRGCRLAEPGEFTRRAYLNGKLDLTQAEAVADIISARSLSAVEAAQQHLRGELGRRISTLAESILRVVAEVEAYIDFPEEDLPPEDTTGPIQALTTIAQELRELSLTSRQRELLITGIPTVIAGAPNAGKSSLLNALLGMRRALVSETPGTTRDFITEPLNIGRHGLRLCDTAGLHETSDTLEKAGIEFTRERIEEAALLLLVLDSSAPLPALPDEILAGFDQTPCVVIENKTDLPGSESFTDFLPAAPHVRLSLKTGEGLDALRQEIERTLDGLIQMNHAEQLMVNARHAEALDKTHAYIKQALAGNERGDPTELIAAELRAAVEALGEIVGRIDNEEILDRIFATFCIGK